MAAVRSILEALPWAVPLFLLVVVIGALGTRWFGRWTSSPWWAGLLLSIALGLVCAMTLTPQDLSPAADSGALDAVASTGASVVAETPWQAVWPADRMLNLLLFVPMGFAVMMIGKPRLRWVLAGCALLLPIGVEAVQWSVTWLQRDSQWQDVLDNTLGVLLGLALGVVARRAMSRRATQDRARGADA